MDMEYYKRSLKMLVMFGIYLTLVRFSQGAFLGVMTLLGVLWAFNGKMGKAFSIYVMVLFMVSINPNILPKEGIMYSLGLRVGPLMIGLALVFRALSYHNRRRLPLGFLMMYLMVAVISSMNGWAPMVSFLKIANFIVFFLGVWLGTQALEHDNDGVMILRSTFFAIAFFLIIGSLVLIPFPGISTLSGLQQARQGGSLEAINQMLQEAALGGDMFLFCGVTMQSQVLSPLLACIFAWLMCDLLFVEREFKWPHAILIVLAIPLLYKTRSRLALLTLVASIAMVYFYLPRYIKMKPVVKRWLGATLLLFASALITTAVVAEARSGAISRWLRKTNDVESDDRSLSEAFMASRQGLIEECMSDFHRNPAFGSGFQVSSFTRDYVKGQTGLILSSPIEKGLLPVMILGETGILGEITFVLFLISFFIGSGRRKLYISITMMSVLLVTNMGEATFFSPGGLGGTLWVVCVVGGYVLDMSMSFNRDRYSTDVCAPQFL